MRLLACTARPSDMEWKSGEIYSEQQDEINQNVGVRQRHVRGKCDINKERNRGAKIKSRSFLQRLFNRLASHLSKNYSGVNYRTNRKGSRPPAVDRSSVKQQQQQQQQQNLPLVVKPQILPDQQRDAAKRLERRRLRKRLIVPLMEDRAAAATATAAEFPVRTADYQAVHIRRLLRRLNDMIDECDNDPEASGGSPAESWTTASGQLPEDAAAATAATLEALACGGSCAATVVARPASEIASSQHTTLLQGCGNIASDPLSAKSTRNRKLTKQQQTYIREDLMAPALLPRRPMTMMHQRFRGYRPYGKQQPLVINMKYRAPVSAAPSASAFKCCCCCCRCCACCCCSKASHGQDMLHGTTTGLRRCHDNDKMKLTSTTLNEAANIRKASSLPLRQSKAEIFHL